LVSTPRVRTRLSLKEKKEKKDYETDEINETDEKIQALNHPIDSEVTYLGKFGSFNA
jgi:hypothetical protein